MNSITEKQKGDEKIPRYLETLQVSKQVDVQFADILSGSERIDSERHIVC